MPNSYFKTLSTFGSSGVYACGIQSSCSNRVIFKNSALVKGRSLAMVIPLRLGHSESQQTVKGWAAPNGMTFAACISGPCIDTLFIYNLVIKHGFQKWQHTEDLLNVHKRKSKFIDDSIPGRSLLLPTSHHKMWSETLVNMCLLRPALCEVMCLGTGDSR